MIDTANTKKKNSFLHYLLLIHGSYYLITAIWPLIDIKSFMLVTGPKTDVWLVKTVGVLIIPIALCLFTCLLFKSSIYQTCVVAITSAVGLAIIDFYYSLIGVISKVYLADGCLEILFALAWLFVIVRPKTP